MNRREAVLRELNLYPQWTRRNTPVPVAVEQPVAAEASSGLGVTDTRESLTPVAQPIPEAVNEITSAYVSQPAIAPASEVDKLDWHELKQRVRGCITCRLRAGCTQTVFGAGDEKADWLFVGEAPGADEDARGEPFVGEAGKLLDNMLMAIKLKRGKNVYVTNIVKCRPPVDESGKQLPPKPDEIAACLPYLHRQIELIQPTLIVALGKTAANALMHGQPSMDKDATLGSLRGTVHDYHGIPLIVTYHPAYLLRSPMNKAEAWQDLCLAVKTHTGGM